MAWRRDSGAKRRCSGATVSFKDHFSRHAAAYAGARPGYPPALFQWLSAQCAGHALAWDAGCGNGQASVALTAHFTKVFASDPSAGQIASALPDPRVQYAVEPAEACRLASASVDLVTVAQAYHWFDQGQFCREVQRVLVPGGVIALWTYAESRVDDAVDALFAQLHDELLASDWPAGREHVITRYRELPFPFAALPVPDLVMSRQWTLAQYLAYLRSWSASERFRVRTGVDPVGLLAAQMETAWGDPQAVRAVIWPLSVRAGRRAD